MKNNDLLEGIEQVDDFTDEEKAELAQAFSNSAGSPHVLASEKVLKKRLQYYYYALAHQKVINDVSTAFLSGRIQQIEESLTISAEYVKDWGPEEGETDGKKA